MELIVPIENKPYLTVKEAVKYFNIGEYKIRRLTDDNDFLVLWNGTKRLIKKEKMQVFLDESYSV